MRRDVRCRRFILKESGRSPVRRLGVVVQPRLSGASIMEGVPNGIGDRPRTRNRKPVVSWWQTNSEASAQSLDSSLRLLRIWRLHLRHLRSIMHSMLCLWWKQHSRKQTSERNVVNFETQGQWLPNLTIMGVTGLWDVSTHSPVKED